jgi:hypothetical protein
MIRHFSLTVCALLLATGCFQKADPVVRADCELEKLDLSTCDRSGLGAIQPQGIWNMDITFDDGERTSGVIKYVGDPTLSGLPISGTRVEPNVFTVTSEVVSASNGSPIKYLFAGCRSTSPTQVEGRFRRCTNGAVDLAGAFQAKRVLRREGESDASGLELVSEIALPRGVGLDVFVAGHYAYVSARESGIYIYDISNPADPKKVSELVPTDDAWHQVWVKDQTMYIASSKKGVLLYDVSNPAAPLALKSFPSDAPDVRSVTGDGTWLYAAAPFPNAEVLVFDATNSRELVVAKRYFVEQTLPALGDRPYEVTVRDGKLYVSHWTYGLAVSDVSNPKQPKLLGHFAYTNATTRMADVGIVGSRTLAFEAGEDWGAHLRVLDVSSPANITQVAEVPLRPEVSIRSAKVSGTKLYVAHYQDGVRVLDISNPNEPRQVGYFNSWRETDSGRGSSFFEGVTDVTVPGDGYLYATDTSRGLLILREKP